MKKLRSMLIVVLLIFCTASLAYSSLFYNEATSGDLKTFDTMRFDLQPGLNTLLGSASYSYDTGVDFDGFLLTLKDDMILTHIDYQVIRVDITDGNVKNAKYDFALKEGDHTSNKILGKSKVAMSKTSQQSMFDRVLPLNGDLDLAFSPTKFSGVVFKNSDFARTVWDYKIDFTTESTAISPANPVPEPASIILISIGLAGLVGARIRRKKQ